MQVSYKNKFWPLDALKLDGSDHDNAALRWRDGCAWARTVASEDQIGPIILFCGAQVEAAHHPLYGQKPHCILISP